MNKVELVKKIKAELKMTTKETEAILDVVFGEMRMALETEGKVKFDFGAFEVVEKAERVGRNPKTGEEIVIPAKKVVKFKPSKEFKEFINK